MRTADFPEDNPAPHDKASSSQDKPMITGKAEPMVANATTFTASNADSL